MPRIVVEQTDLDQAGPSGGCTLLSIDQIGAALEIEWGQGTI